MYKSRFSCLSQYFVWQMQLVLLVHYISIGLFWQHFVKFFCKLYLQIDVAVLH